MCSGSVYAYGGTTIKSGPKPVATYVSGEIISTVLDGTKGQITATVCVSDAPVCDYYIMFKSTPYNKQGFPYKYMRMHEFQIKKVIN